MYQLSHTFGYQSDCTISAEVQERTIVAMLGKTVTTYEANREVKYANNGTECAVRMWMNERGSLTGETEGPGLVSVSLLNAGSRTQFMIQIDLVETPDWMKCGGEDCTCDSDDGECEECCMQESCWFCDGQVETVTWLSYEQAKDLLASMESTDCR